MPVPRALARMRELRPATLGTGERLFPRLMIQVWTESTRTPALTGVLTDGYAKIRTAWGGRAESCKDAGLLPEDADVDARARAMIALVQGFAAQTALLGDIPPQVLADGTRALMNVARGQ
ncbi:TetR family transcriptional regulator C-terminal domain-containing protein [Streptomyces cellulosae]|nr:TetR family transcriptional regulator C-terminal domain-containing protein [Streptomyces cellulosae]